MTQQYKLIYHPLHNITTNKQTNKHLMSWLWYIDPLISSAPNNTAENVVAKSAAEFYLVAPRCFPFLWLHAVMTLYDANWGLALKLITATHTR